MLRAVESTPSNGVLAIAQKTVPSYPLTGVTTQTMMDTVNIIVPQTITPESELLISVRWSCNSSANAKTMQVQFSDIGTTPAFLPFSDVQTTNISNEWLFRITFVGSTAQAQILSSSKTPGASTSAFQNTTYQLNYSGVPGQPLQMSFWGTLASATDTMQIQSFSVWYNPSAAYPTNRIQPGTKLFWGGNAHWTDIVAGGGSVTPAQLIANLQAMNMTMVRMDIDNVGYSWQTSDNSLAAVVTMAQALQGSGIQMYALIALDLTSDGTNFWTSEAAAYAYGYAYARHCVSALKPYGVTIYECGNELDTAHNINQAGATGYYAYQFSNTIWPILRGAMGGCIAGVQSMGCKAASNAFTICAVGAMNYLWNGISPDLTTGHAQCRWDISAFHNYEPYGHLTGMSTYTNGPYVNVLEYLHQQFGVPIYISEFNGQNGNTEAQNVTWCTRTMTEIYNLRYKYNIMGACIYEMYGGDPWGMVTTPATNTLSSPLGTSISALMSSLVDSGN